MTENINNQFINTKRQKALGIVELIAIALGGMVGGGIFTILGISVSMIGPYTPLAIALGGIIAALAAYSYVKLAVYYKDEGATYAFFKKTFPGSPFAASLIGWLVVFGYISTLALYAYTFSSYAISGFAFADTEWARKAIAGMVIAIFALINIWSVKGMGKIEDFMVYTKLIILVVISFILLNNSHASLPSLIADGGTVSVLDILIVASLTFVAYEGFQLVIHAMNEMDHPQTNIPKAIYSAIGIAIAIYIIVALGTIMAIPFDDIINNKEYALASGAGAILGQWGTDLVIAGALLATGSAISGTIFGASRLMSVIARDGFFPAKLARRSRHIPITAIITMSGLAACLIAVGNLRVILEFGSVTFLLVSVLMAYANYKIRDKTNSSAFLTIAALSGLAMGSIFIIYYEATTQIEQLFFIVGLYTLLTFAALLFSNDAWSSKT